jgi:hypothetical protein
MNGNVLLLVQVKKMSRVWCLSLIALGIMIAPSFPVIAQVPTLEPSGVNQGGSVLPDLMLPESIGTAVLQTAAVESGLPLAQLTVEKAKAKTWSDGCLGLAPPDQMCAAVLVRGWEVTVVHQRQEWVYRTSATGQKIVLDPAGSHLSRLIVPPAEQIPANQLPAKLERSVVFREIKSGGFAGINQEIRLYKDGRLVRQSPSTSPKPTQGVVIRTLPKAQVKAFQKVLESRHFGQFGGLRYPPKTGAADYFSYTLGNWQTTVEYTDISSKELPPDLEQVIQAWRSLISPQ